MLSLIGNKLFQRFDFQKISILSVLSFHFHINRQKAKETRGNNRAYCSIYLDIQNFENKRGSVAFRDSFRDNR